MKMNKTSVKLVAKRKRKSEVDSLFDNLSFIYSEKSCSLPKIDLINAKNDGIESLKTHGGRRWCLDSTLYCDRVIDHNSQKFSMAMEDHSQVNQQSNKDKEDMLFKCVKADKNILQNKNKKNKRKSEIDALFDHLSFIYSDKKSCLPKEDKQARKLPNKELVNDENDKEWSLYNKIAHSSEIIDHDTPRTPEIAEQLQINKIFNNDANNNILFEGNKVKSKNKETLQTQLIGGSKLVKKKNFKVGDVVICYFKYFGWWFGKIIQHNKRAAEGNCWVSSFGDHKILMVPLHSLRHHYDFSSKFNQTKMKKPLYKKAVKEFLSELAEQSNFKIMFGQKGYLNELLEWGLNGFAAHVIKDKNKPCQGNLDFTNTSLNQSIDFVIESSDTSNTESSKLTSKDNSESIDFLLKNYSLSPNLEDSDNYFSSDQHSSINSFKNNEVDSKKSLCKVKNRSKINVLKSSIINHTAQSTNLECQNTVIKNSECENIKKNIENYNAQDWFLNKVDHVRKDCLEKMTHTIQRSPDKILSNIEHNDVTCKDFLCNSKHPSFHSNSTPLQTSCLKENSNQTMRLYKDGIKLDVTLLNEKTPKRACSIKNQTLSSVSPNNVSCASITIGKKQKCVIENKYSSKKNDKTCDREIGSDFFQIKIGDLVLGKLKGYDWWFGMVVSHRVIRQRPAANDCHWIRWYGDHKVSEVHLQNIELLTSFSNRYLPSKMQGLYLRAIKELLEEAARRCCKTDLPDDEKRLGVLVDWALNGFQPYGFDKLSIEETLTLEDDAFIQEGSETDSLTHNEGEPLPSPILSEDVKALFDKAANGNMDLNKICLGCGDLKCIMEHPLFIGGLCKECKESFMETAYLYDEDGSQMYCSICSDGREIILCDVPGCYRSYCSVCLDMFCGVGYSRTVSAGLDWHCFMCTGEKVRLIQRRDDWQQRLKNVFSVNNEGYPLPFFYDPVPFEDRPSLRVLSLFDGLSTGYLALSELGLDILSYQASEIDPLAIKVSKVHHSMRVEQIGDVQKITKQDIENWGPFDLVIGGSPCDELSIANPFRKGIYEGTGQLFFEFYRILEYCKPQPLTARPFFWLFENVVGMRYTDRAVISRFLQCHPVIINAKEISAQQRTRYFWGNLPGMNRAMCPLPSDRLKLQQCLEKDCGRVAKFDKVRCITTSQNSLKQTKAAMLPVKWTISRNSQLDDGLWLTEIERIFGFPDHYTDVANMGQRDRQKLLGKSWSVPVLRHLFAPLRNYFRSKVYIDNYNSML
ncbi:DNA (cytosine-5)-methyltransferase 3A isoform X2 [Hydra vulgaris]|uniref:DNA (cytosine-5)-methyltransferase 3A isoform X2 n=1 Tax=Hydra vulgaris TaxID=6087 RepID=UPI001F5E62CE|nr:DNA (cytosine-5)-methyltransferase 3A isoform X2 [Hydra vulgaris]